MKVRDSCSEDRSAIPSQAATSKPAQPARPEATASASDILGLKRKKAMGRQAVSLEMEVDQYLSNPNSGTSILDFWQVVLIPSTYIHMNDFTNYIICDAGTSTSISSYFSSCNGYNTHSGLERCL